MYENKIHSGPNQPTGNMKKNIEFQQRRSLMDIRLLLCLVLLLLFSTLKVCADDEEEEAPQVQLKKPKPQERLTSHLEMGCAPPVNCIPSTSCPR